MTKPNPSLPGKEPNAQDALTKAWMDMSTSQDTHPEPEVLAAYAEGVLEETARTACEEHISCCKTCLDTVREIWLQLQQTANEMPKESNRLRILRPGWLMQAACLLIGISGLVLGSWFFVDCRRGQEQTLSLENRLAQSQLQLAQAYKEAFLTMSPRIMRDYWLNEKTSPQLLMLPRVRGSEPVSPEAAAFANKARKELLNVLDHCTDRGPALLSLVALEITAGKLPEAQKQLQDAQEVLGFSPEVQNLQALLYLAQGDKESATKAEACLWQLIAEYPDYLPARYNLALLLQELQRDVECRRAWEEYLKREQRPEYRKAAQRHLSSL